MAEGRRPQLKSGNGLHNPEPPTKALSDENSRCRLSRQEAPASAVEPDDAPPISPIALAAGRDDDMNPSDLESAHLQRAWPTEFADGERCAFLQRFAGEREKGGYPLGFHGWPLHRRNAWFAGFNFGLLEHAQVLMEVADG